MLRQCTSYLFYIRYQRVGHLSPQRHRDMSRFPATLCCASLSLPFVPIKSVQVRRLARSRRAATFGELARLETMLLQHIPLRHCLADARLAVQTWRNALSHQHSISSALAQVRNVNACRRLPTYKTATSNARLCLHLPVAPQNRLLQPRGTWLW